MPLSTKYALIFMAIALAVGGCARPLPVTKDWIRDLQTEGVRDDRHDIVRWGNDPEHYASWRTHTNRLVPVYTFGTYGAGKGVDLSSYSGKNSAYRDADRLISLYGRLPDDSLDPRADHIDLTDLATLQRAALAAGRRHLFLVVFDGMDWQTTRAAAIYRTGRVAYRTGRGSGLHFQNYEASGTSQFAYAVTSPTDDRSRGMPDTQEIVDSGDGSFGGYRAESGGYDPWSPGAEPDYVIGRQADGPIRHAVTDSGAAGTAICSGVKTFNGAINVDGKGRQLSTVAHAMQAAGFAVGAVTNVPISHATVASAYAHNVYRFDYQDLTRDLLGLPSVAHPDVPLPGLDVLIGCGYGAVREQDPRQGSDFVPGNRYLTDEDLRQVDANASGEYVVAMRTAGVEGTASLAAAASTAARDGQRLLGFFGVAEYEHLPYRTADGDFWPAPDHDLAQERYTDADLLENPTLAEMTVAALEVLGAGGRGFWLMVEAGDVDWANHDANVDNAIGAVLDGDAAVRVITDWVEAHSNWDESLLIVNADHGHYLVIVEPEDLVDRSR